MSSSFSPREEIARQRSAASYQRLHEAGKTEEAQRDLARLAIIRQKREEASRKKEAERKGVLLLFVVCVCVRVHACVCVRTCVCTCVCELYVNVVWEVCT